MTYIKGTLESNSSVELADIYGSAGTAGLSDAFTNSGTVETTGTSGTSITPDLDSNFWESTTPSTLKFKIDGNDVIFEEQEILYLKEMLTDWIKEHRPESLL